MELKGIIAAAVTPMTAAQEIDYPGISRLCAHLFDNGIRAVFAVGTTGEGYAMSTEEKAEATRAWADAIGGRGDLYVGVGMPGTLDVLRMLEAVRDIPAKAYSVVTPYFVAPTQEMLIAHYRRIADAATLPVVLYNIPFRTGVALEPETVARLAEHPNIAGIKDSSGDIGNIKRYIALTKGQDFSVLSGSDNLILDCLLEGGTGAIAATTNIAPQILSALYAAYERGDLAAARREQERLLPLCEILGPSVVPALLKRLTHEVCPVGPVRLPLADPDVTERMRGVLKGLERREER
ncbi:MAG: 4-hydroxy-tetrahydrodipicolinate synthase [Clostridiales bacterium]|jgi:4-hydroxy-tetrahydrodipicolinate synthase|nr:4-hydroxy-tetrahydrodipicolinate synthase [Clostridiales bacterium]